VALLVTVMVPARQDLSTDLSTEGDGVLTGGARRRVERDLAAGACDNKSRVGITRRTGPSVTSSVARVLSAPLRATAWLFAAEGGRTTGNTPQLLAALAADIFESVTGAARSVVARLVAPMNATLENLVARVGASSVGIGFTASEGVASLATGTSLLGYCDLAVWTGARVAHLGTAVRAAMATGPSARVAAGVRSDVRIAGWVDHLATEAVVLVHADLRRLTVRAAERFARPTFLLLRPLFDAEKVENTEAVAATPRCDGMADHLEAVGTFVSQLRELLRDRLCQASIFVAAAGCAFSLTNAKLWLWRKCCAGGGWRCGRRP
jgi:hypothetical protein